MILTIKAFKRGLAKINLLYLAYVFQFFCALFFSLRIYNEWGTDFGIYYVGGWSTRQSDYGLYSNFFDLKGPAYYGFIKLFSYLFPYSFFGAVLTLFITMFFWFFISNIAVLMISKNVQVRTTLAFASISILIGQNSNASMSLFSSGFVLLTISLIWRFKVTQELWCLILAIFFAVQTYLVKIDGLSVILVFAFLLFVKLKISKIKIVGISLISFSIFSVISIYLYSVFLNFSVSDYFYQSVKFVRQVRWSVNDFSASTSLKHFIIRDYNSLTLLLASGLVFSFLFLNFKRNERVDSNVWIFGLLSVGALNYIALQSDKNYHLVVFYPFALIALTLSLNENRDFKFKSFLLIFVFSASLSITNFAVDSRCVITQNSVCSSPYDGLILDDANSDIKSRSFYLNQGWPYLVNDVLPKVNFTVWWPLAVETKKSSTQIITEANNSLEISIYVDYNDFIFLQKQNPELTNKFLKGRELIQPKQGERWAELRPFTFN